LTDESVRPTLKPRNVRRSVESGDELAGQEPNLPH
jgi:hypothetical protein